MSDDDLIEPDCVPGAPHPRFAPRVIGHDDALRQFRTALDQGRLHHGWLLTGPRGTGKATMAWAMARWLLTDGPTGDTPPTPQESSLLRRMTRLATHQLHLVRRSTDEKTGRLRAEITADDIRKLHSFFHLSAAEGSRRVVIIDAADEMNANAANALLKVLEEPPTGAVLILISHQPARLLPTIRSRCRELRLHPVSPDDMAVVLAQLGIDADAEKLDALSGGSIGEAVRLAGQNGLAIYQDIINLFSTLPAMDRQAAISLANLAGGRATYAGDPFDLMVTLLDRFVTRAAQAGLLSPPLPEAATGEAQLLGRISPDDRAARYWADAQASLSARARAGRSVNLDPAALVLDMLIGLADQQIAT